MPRSNYSGISRLEPKVMPQAHSDAQIVEILTRLVCATEWDQVRLKASADNRSTRALAYTKEIVEEHLPVLVFEYPGDISHVRGCSLYDESLSIVLVSSQDSPNARRFTIVHELVHLLMRESGICAPLSAGISDQLERRCNALAGEALMPTVPVREQTREIDAAGVERAIDRLAITYRVSHSAAAVRLWQLDTIDVDELQRLLSHYRSQWDEGRKKQAEKKGGRSFHQLQAQRLGQTFANTVLSGVELAGNRQPLSVSIAVVPSLIGGRVPAGVASAPRGGPRTAGRATRSPQLPYLHILRDSTSRLAPTPLARVRVAMRRTFRSPQWGCASPATPTLTGPPSFQTWCTPLRP